MLCTTAFYPVDNYPLDSKVIHWIRLIHWISYPCFEQPAPVLLKCTGTVRDVTSRLIGGVNIHIFGSARRISFVKSVANKRNSLGRTEYMNIHPPIIICKGGQLRLGTVVVDCAKGAVETRDSSSRLCKGES